jgi:hypothetical protein
MALPWSGILDASRAVDWTYAGIPGGIPNRTAIYTTLNPSATSAQINTAIANCPKGQSVFLSQGAYSLTATLNFNRDSVTLKGAGMGKTVLNMNTGTSSAMATIQTSTTYGVAGTISSGYAKGSTSVTVSNASGISAGNMMLLYEGNDLDLVWTRSGAADVIRQPVMVIAVNGSTVTFSPPLVFTFQSSLNPRYATYNPTPPSMLGLEDMTINQTSTGEWATLWFCGYANWFKNVEITSCGEIALCLTQTVRNEVRGCFIHGTSTPNEGYGVDAYTENTGLLIEDNIFDSLWTGTILDNAMGSVVAYNYSRNMFVPPLGAWANQTPGFITQHMAHGMMTLWEGNIGAGIQSDGYHGSGSHQTIYRNWFNGLHPYYASNRKMIDLDRFTYYCNVSGNVLGDASWTPAEYEMTGSPGYTNSVIYRLGYPNMGNNGYSATNPPSNADAGGLDPKVKTTLFRWGNYDYKNNVARWDAAEVPSGVSVPADHNLPASLYLTAKPTWWCDSLAWPAIGPDVTGLSNDIPAKLRYEGRSCPRTAVEVSKPGNLTDGQALFTAYNIRGQLAASFKGRYDGHYAGFSMAERNLANGLYVWVVRQGNVTYVMKRMVLR